MYTGFGWFLHGPPPNGDCWLTFPICSTNTQSCGMVVGYPLAQLLDLRVDVSAIARACRFQGTLTDPERFESPEIVLEKHDFSYPDCTQSFFLLLRRRRRRYTAACRAAEHHGSIHRCCTHTTARATRFLPRTTRHQYSHARLHAKLHTRRVRPSVLCCGALYHHYT